MQIGFHECKLLLLQSLKLEIDERATTFLAPD
jgi:hypothetical protein